ncbi:MAG: ankyrin repeat domain-containing protein [Acidimicrobiales bacterium]
MTEPTDVQLLAGAIQTGDLDGIRRILDRRPELANGPLGEHLKERTALHVVADWPGFFPRGPEVVRLLVSHGADPNPPLTKPGDENPLHWAASSDDVDVARALIDIGADIEAPDGSIGTPLGNAIGYCCWHVAELLFQRGARVDVLWHAAGLGLVDRINDLVESDPPSRQALSEAFWHACSGARRRAAQRLLELGADPSWVLRPHSDETPLGAARGLGTARSLLITWLEEIGAPPTPESGG